MTNVSSKRRACTPWIIGAGVVLIALIGAVVIAVTRSDQSEGDPAAIVESNAVVIDGASLPEFTGVETVLGARGPRATGTGFDGIRVELFADGETAVIAFFAHWCPVCQTEVDELSDHLNDGGQPSDERVVARVSGAIGAAQFDDLLDLARTGAPT